jgi:hypothetical protein
MKKNRGKIIVLILIVGIVSTFFIPLRQAQSAGAIAYILKEFTLDVLARVISRTFLSKMVNGVLDAIGKGGRGNEAAFVKDWRSFTQEAQSRGETIAETIIADAAIGKNPTICPFLRQELLNVFGINRTKLGEIQNILNKFNSSRFKINSSQAFKYVVNCTMPKNFDIKAFQDDFANGGWAAFVELSKPQNNLLGLYSAAADEITTQRSVEGEINSQEAEAGSGFLSSRPDCEGRGAGSLCVIYGEVKTPADVIKEAAGKTKTAELDWLVSGDELSEVLLNVASSLIAGLRDMLANKIIEVIVPEESAGAGGKLMKSAIRDCLNQYENTCTLKAKELRCAAESSGSASGSFSSTNCEEVINQGVYGACMAEANDICRSP